MRNISSSEGDLYYDSRSRSPQQQAATGLAAGAALFREEQECWVAIDEASGWAAIDEALATTGTAEARS